MYKFLLSWRYLRTRWIAVASIISVTLGVATMIIVNSVMDGFTAEMYNRLHGILSDVVFDSHGLSGIPDPGWHETEIRKVLGDDLVGVSAAVRVPAMLNFQVRGEWITQQVMAIGIDEKTYAEVGDFSKFLLHPGNRERLSFLLRPDGYDSPLPTSGWEHRRLRVGYERAYHEQLEQIERNRQARFRRQTGQLLPSDEGAEFPPAADLADNDSRELPTADEPTDDKPAADEPAADEPAADTIAAGGAFPSGDDADEPVAESETRLPRLSLNDHQPPRALNAVADPFRTGRSESEEPLETFDEMQEQHTGLVLGIAITSVRHRNPDGTVQNYFLARPGDDVQITFPTSGQPPKAVTGKFTIVDLYQSKMSEYDSMFAFMPIEKLQQLRGMVDPASGIPSVTSIQLKLRPGANLNAARDKLRARFPADQYTYRIETWRDLQGPLLAAVQMETTILNILLFLIIAVAGFGILATFFMIVVEKTRDIGVLKSLGAPSGGVMTIFLNYGLSLGVLGSGMGMVLGLLFVAYINEIASVLESLLGQQLFDPTVYYFQKIPTIVNPGTVAWVVGGAIVIAVLASVLPSLRAARLHPVEALRYE